MTLLRTVKKALGKLPTSKKLVVGVSGGADSVALAFLLKNLGYKIVIAHLNHGLRGKESDADETLVKKLAKQWGVPCMTKKIDEQSLGSGNRENRLRQLRYEFLEKARQHHKAAFVAVAHHRDDQIETILMHMARGAGLRGIRGMSPVQSYVIRPLLDIPKQDLIDLLHKERIPFRTDQSNFDLDLRRNHFRHILVPELKAEWPSLETDLLALADLARKEAQKMEEKAKQWVKKHVADHSFSRKAFLELGDEIQSEVLFEIAGREDLYRRALEELKSLIHKGTTGKQKKFGPWIFRIQYNEILLQPKKPPEFLPDKLQPILGKSQWGEWILTNRGAKGLYVRSWKPGDRFKPSGMQGSKKLQDLFTDLKIPKSERHRIPIITDQEKRILAVGNLRVARNAGYLKRFLLIRKNRNAE
jgi:tRNA(Ile)-lysidine synthase